MKKLSHIALVAFLFLGLSCTRSHAQQGYIPDHCITGLKQVAAFNISSAVTTSIIAPITGANIYVCGMVLSQAVGAGTLAFEYGTGSTCGTGTQIIAGPFTAQTSAPGMPIVVPAAGYTQFSTNAGAGAMIPSQRLCALSTGSIVQAGYLTFVQE
jgi:hypothetical protein